MRHWERSDKSDKVLNEKMLFLMRIGLRSSIGKCGLLKRRHTLFFLRKRQAHLHLYSHLTLLRTAYFLLQARARAKRVEPWIILSKTKTTKIIQRISIGCSNNRAASPP
jgi:hypothetical protein